MKKVLSFTDHLFHWDADQSLFNKILSVVTVLFGAFCLIWILLSSFGLFDNFVTHNHNWAADHGNASALGWIFLIATVFWAWLNFSEKIPFQVSPLAFDIILLILLILTVLANCNFRFDHMNYIR